MTVENRMLRENFDLRIIIRSFITLLFTRYWKYQVKDSEMDKACSMHRRGLHTRSR
jgi:hypothetical protein